jgi:hypothetical protein
MEPCRFGSRWFKLSEQRQPEQPRNENGKDQYPITLYKMAKNS